MPSLSQIAKHIGVSKPRAGQLKQQGMPTNTLRAAKLWRDSQQKKRESTNSKTANLQKKRGRPRNPPKLSKTGDALTDILKNAMARAEVAHHAYTSAALANESNQAVLLSNSTKADEAVARIERMAREEQERRGILVNKHEAAAMVRRFVDAMIRRLRRLPDECGPQCNEQEPLRAVKILQATVDEILQAGQEAISGI